VVSIPVHLAAVDLCGTSSLGRYKSIELCSSLPVEKSLFVASARGDFCCRNWRGCS